MSIFPSSLPPEPPSGQPTPPAPPPQGAAPPPYGPPPTQQYAPPPAYYAPPPPAEGGGWKIPALFVAVIHSLGANGYLYYQMTHVQKNIVDNADATQARLDKLE